MTSNLVVNGILLQSLWTLGSVCAALALVAGLLLVLAPVKSLHLAQKLNREYSFAWFALLLDAPRSSEPFIYRHHRVFGLGLALASVYLLQQLFTAVTPAAAARLWGGALPPQLALAVMETFLYLFIAGAVVGVVLGGVIFVRPSLVKPLERWSNTWLATDRAAAVLDRRDDRPEGLAQRYPRVLGMVIITATLYVVLMALLLVT